MTIEEMALRLALDAHAGRESGAHESWVMGVRHAAARLREWGEDDGNDD